MFKGPKLDMRPGPLLQWANDLVRKIQKKISATYVHNTSGGTLVRGSIVRYYQGDREVTPPNCSAAGSSATTARAIGVLVEDVPTTKWGVMRTDDKTYVLFEPNLAPAPAAGDPVYVSAISGVLATNVAPAGAGMWVTKIGTVADGTPYATEMACWIEQKYCCEPTNPRQ